MCVDSDAGVVVCGGGVDDTVAVAATAADAEAAEAPRGVSDISRNCDCNFALSDADWTTGVEAEDDDDDDARREKIILLSVKTRKTENGKSLFFSLSLSLFAFVFFFFLMLLANPIGAARRASSAAASASLSSRYPSSRDPARLQWQPGNLGRLAKSRPFLPCSDPRKKTKPPSLTTTRHSLAFLRCALFFLLSLSLSCSSFSVFC